VLLEFSIISIGILMLFNPEKAAGHRFGKLVSTNLIQIPQEITIPPIPANSLLVIYAQYSRLSKNSLSSLVGLDRHIPLCFYNFVPRKYHHAYSVNGLENILEPITG